MNLSILILFCLFGLVLSSVESILFNNELADNQAYKQAVLENRNKLRQLLEGSSTNLKGLKTALIRMDAYIKNFEQLTDQNINPNTGLRFVPQRWEISAEEIKQLPEYQSLFAAISSKQQERHTLRLYIAKQIKSIRTVDKVGFQRKSVEVVAISTVLFNKSQRGLLRLDFLRADYLRSVSSRIKKAFIDKIEYLKLAIAARIALQLVAPLSFYSIPKNYRQRVSLMPALLRLKLQNSQYINHLDKMRSIMIQTIVGRKGGDIKKKAEELCDWILAAEDRKNAEMKNLRRGVLQEIQKLMNTG